MAGPSETVTQQIEYATDHADDAFDSAQLFLEKLANYVSGVAPIAESGFFQDVTTPQSDFVIPNSPTEPVINPVTISIPSFTPLAVDSTFGSLGPAPEFLVADPTLNLPLAPGVLTVTAPTDAPNIDTNFVYPTAPTETELALPSVPLFEELNIPAAPTINIPTFTEGLPDVTTIGPPPGDTFNWTEAMYTDALLAQTSTELYNRITNGGTGLNATVEQAIWDRARNREDINAVRSAQQLVIEQAARGFSRPTGSMLAGLDLLAQETQNKNADLSREIAIKQAELEQSNIQFALESSIKLEGQLLGFADSMQNRALEAEKVTVELAIELYKARVSQFQIELDTYKAAASVFETEVKAELTRIEIYKTEVQAQGLINDINDSSVKLYVAQLEGVKTTVDIYRSEIDAVNSRIQSEALKLDLFKSEVQAYGLQVSAKRDEFGIYAEQVKAELTKVTVFEAQASAFAARIQAYSTQVGAEAAKVDARVESSKAHTQGYLATVDGLIKQAQANQVQVQSAVDIFKGQSTVFTAKVGAEEARVSAESKLYDLAVREATAQAEISIKNAEIALINADNISKLQLEAIKAGATVSSQLAASSLSALNIGASISGSESDVHSYQEK